MKRRLLSLLLVMAMLLSMVPFQAFAEEVDEAPALLEETEEIVSEIPEDTVPEITVETVPETTEETVPETTEETVPVVLEEDPALPEEEEVPVLLEEPEQAEAAVPAEGEQGDETVVTMRANETLDLSERWPGCTYSLGEGYEQYASLVGSVLTPKEGLEIPEDPGYVVVRLYADNGEESVPILVKIYLPLMILEGMEPGEDMPQKHLRVGDEFQLQARLTEGSEINEGIAWSLDTNEKYDACPPFSVATDGTVTFNESFVFDEEDAVGGAWNMVVAEQVVGPDDEKTVADTPAVIAMFPELALDMYIGDDKFEEEGTINAVNGFKPVSITAFPKDFGPFGGVTLTLDDSNKVLKSAKKTTDHIDGLDCESEVYTVTPKKCGTFTITATSKDNPEVTLTTTVTVVNETREINIKVPASARFLEAEGEKGVIMTAGQKLALSTDIPKTAADKAVTWEIIPPYDLAPKSVLESIAPEGAVVAEPEWESVVSIDEKGVLRTNAGVTMESVIVGVRVLLTSTAEDEEPVEDYLMVLIQPPVETLFVQAIPLGNIEPKNNDLQEFMDGGTNIKIPLPVDYPINEGPMLFIPIGMSNSGGSQPLLYPDVSWKFSGSKKVVEFMTLDEYFGDSEITQSGAFVELRALGARVMIPKAPGKASFTATSRDGSGAKFSATINLFGPYFADASVNAPKDFDPSKPLHPGDQVQFTSEAYYYEGAPATDAQRYWYVYERVDKRRNPPTDFATIDQKGKLTITDRVNKPAELTVVCYLYNKEGAEEEATYSVYVEPVNDTLGLLSQSGRLLNTAYPYIYEPGEEMTLQPVWVDKTGQVHEPVAAEDVSYKVSGSACAFDKTTGKLTFKKPGTTKLTVTATLDGKKQSATYTFRCEYFTRKTEIQNKPESGVITVVGGKSLTLKAVNWSSDTTKATDQSIFWRLDGPNADINWKTGKLTTDKVSQAREVTVYAYCDGKTAGDYNSVSDSVTIRIIPEKTQYRSRGYFIYNEEKSYGDGNYFYLTGVEQVLNAYDVFEYDAYSYGIHIPTSMTKLTSSNPKIVEIVNNNEGDPINIRIPADAKPGKVTITIHGKMVDDQYYPIYQDAPSVKITVNVVKPVTSIEIKRPTDKAGNELPLYVGKSLKLSSTVDKDATNKKLVWHISDKAPEHPRDDRGLNFLDKTTIKNGVLKVDKSTLTMSRYYYVWATSEDGYEASNLLEIQAYAMTGAIHIASRGDWLDGNSARYLNNRTVTIEQGEELEFGALVYDVNGGYGANPDITWTISGKKNIVEKLYDGIPEETETDVLALKGLNPGTVTIKATAKDGSRKTATFKLIVSEEKYEPDEPDEPDEPGVAKLGSVYYDDLQEALDAVVGDDTVTLLQDVSLDKTLTFDKNSGRVFLDLNGHNIHCETQRAIHVLQGWLVLRGQGTVSSNNPDVTSSVIRVGGDNTTYGADLSVDENVTISTHSCYGITVFGGSTECLSVYGTVTSTAPANNNYDGCAISTSGTDTTPSTIRIYKGNISAANTNAIYMPSGTLEVYNNPTITGLTGIYVKSGNTTIDGGTINGVGPQKDYTYHGNGGVSTGDALVVDSCGYPNGAPTVTIEGGTFNSTNAKSVGVYKHGEDTPDADVTITGGTFNPQHNLG